MSGPPPDDLRVRELLGDGPPGVPVPVLPPATSARDSRSPQVSPAALPQVVVEAIPDRESSSPGLPFDPQILLTGIWKRRPLIAAVTLVVLALSVALALAVRSHQWEVWVTILRKREQKEYLVTSATTPIVKLQVYSMPTVLRLVKVNENLKAVIDDLKLDVGASELSSHIAVDNPRDTDIVEILVRWSDPGQAVGIANSLARAFVHNADRLQKLEAIQAHEYLTAQLASVQARLGTLDAAVVAYKSTHGIVKLSDQAGRLVEQLAEFDVLAEKERLDAEMAAASARLTREELRHQAGTVVASVFVKKPLRAHLVELQTQLADALAIYTDESAKVKELRDEISRVEDLVRQGLEEQLHEQTVSRNPVLSSLEQALVDRTVEAAARDARAQGYAAVRDRYRLSLLELPGVESRLAELQGQLDTLREVERTLAGRVEEVQIIRDSTASGFSIMQEARPPQFPLPSKAKLIVLAGLVLGLGLGVVVAAIRELSDTSLKAAREVERVLGLKAVGEIPMLAAEQVRLKMPAAGNAAEVFRQLLTTLLQLRPGEGPWRLLVTSAGAFEGRTTVCLNLARVAAARGLTVCVVDADVRKPNLDLMGPLLGIPAEAPGLAAVLRGACDVSEAVVHPEPGGPSFLPAGRVGGLPPEALGGAGMRGAMAALGARFDLVLLDTAPVLAVADALLLVPAVDRALLVVEASGLPRAALRVALERLRGAGVEITGVVLNKVRSEYLHPFSVHGLAARSSGGGHAEAG